MRYLFMWIDKGDIVITKGNIISENCKAMVNEGTMTIVDLELQEQMLPATNYYQEIDEETI